MVREIVYEPPVYEFVKNRIVKTAEASTESIYCSCILTARHLGANLPKGDAKDLQRNSTPTIGGVVILKYWSEEQQDWIYHTSVIQFLMPGGMWVQEGNKIRCKYTERFIHFSDSHLIGFWNEI